MKTLSFLLISLVGLGFILYMGTVFLPPETPRQRAVSDMRGCEARAGIPSSSDPTYDAKRQHRYGAYVQCMVGLGYTSATMP